MDNKLYNIEDFVNEELSSSPIFNLSMASKELFHSNLLFWLSLKHKSCFINILEKMGVDTKKWQNSWRSYREKNNYDLCIYDTSKNSISFILENKVKSIPRKDQLDKYSEETRSLNKEDKILLTLTTDFPNKDEIEKTWTIKSYEDLANIITDNICSISDCYHQMLLNDYCKTIRLLHKIQSNWSYEKEDKYIEKFVTEKSEDTIKIGDIRKKVLYSKLAIDIQKEINGQIKTNKEIINITENNYEARNSPYVNCGMTHSMGILDIKVRVIGNLILGIQLQGPSYKHYIESLDKEEQNKMIIDWIRSYNKDCENCKDNNQELLIKLINSNFFQFGERTLNGFPFSEEEEAIIPNNRDKFNKYGDYFIYQYVNIAPNTTIKKIIEAIKEDVKKIYDIISVHKLTNDTNHKL